MSIFKGFRSHIKDVMTGGGDLNNNLFPKEVRRMVPKELQPGGFDPARDWLGYDIKADPIRDAKIADRQATQAAFADYNQGTQPLRGVGMNNPQQLQAAQGLLAAGAFQPNGSYGQQAQSLASQPVNGSYGMQAGQLTQQQPVAYGMPSQVYGAPGYGQTYDNPNQMRSFRLVGGMR